MKFITSYNVIVKVKHKCTFRGSQVVHDFIHQTSSLKCVTSYNVTAKIKRKYKVRGSQVVHDFIYQTSC